MDDSDEPNEEIVESSGTTNISARMIYTGHEEMQHLCCSLIMQKGARRIITGQIKIQGGMKNVLKEIICCAVGIFLKSLMFVKLLSWLIIQILFYTRILYQYFLYCMNGLQNCDADY